MPTYSYKCPTCGHAFDIQQSFTDGSLTDCPNCGGALRKVFSAVGVTFNGAGFYRTDSRSGSGSKEDAGSGASSPAPTPASVPSTPAPASTSSGSSSTPSSTTSAS